MTLDSGPYRRQGFRERAARAVRSIESMLSEPGGWLDPEERAELEAAQATIERFTR